MRERSKAAVRKLASAVSIGLLVGFVVGLTRSIWLTIIPNQYVDQGLYRLTAFTVRDSLNSQVGFFVAVSVAALIVLTIAREAISSRLVRGLLHIRVRTGHRARRIAKASYMKYVQGIAGGLALVLVALNIALAVGSARNTRQKPHVIVISIDSLRADHLGCYGYDRNTTPNLDAFAKENLLFKNCFSQDQFTLSSHMSLLTSLYPPAHKVAPQRSLDPATTTLAEVLKNDGYRTMGFVRSCAWMEPSYGFGQGFDSYVVRDYSPQQPELNAEHQNRFVAQQLEGVKDDRLFLFLHYYDVHSDWHKLPYDAPQPYREKFSSGYEGDFNGGFGGKVASQYLSYVSLNRIPLKERDLTYITSLYDNGIAYMDRCIGGLFEMLKEKGLYDDSLIIITSDHGEEFQEHGCMLHCNSYLHDELTRVPLLVKLPGKTGRHLEFGELVESVDIMPSILDIAAITNRPPMQGKSLVDLVEGSEGWKESIYAFGGEGNNIFGCDGNAFVRTERWKLVCDNLNRDDGFKLFDLQADPREQQDVKKQHPDVAERMKRQILARYAQVQARTTKQEVMLTQRNREMLKSLGYVN